MVEQNIDKQIKEAEEEEYHWWSAYMGEEAAELGYDSKKANEYKKKYYEASQKVRELKMKKASLNGEHPLYYTTSLLDYCQNSKERKMLANNSFAVYTDGETFYITKYDESLKDMVDAKDIDWDYIVPANEIRKWMEENIF